MRVASDLAVFLPNFNHARYLAEALDALLAQSVPPAFISVIDDGSTDESVQIIERYAAAHPHVRPVFHTENFGVERNMATWLAAVDTRYVYFGASDDVVMPGLFEQSLELLRRHPQAGLCSALCRLKDETGRDLGVLETPIHLKRSGYIGPADAGRLLLQDDGWFNGSTTIYHREKLVAAGGFDPELGSFTDGFVSCVVALHSGACFIPEPLAYWRRQDAGLARQTAFNLASSRRVADRVEALVNRHYVSLFPKGYVAIWRKRWIFGILRANLSSGDAKCWVAAEELLQFPPFVRGKLFAPTLMRLRSWRLLWILYAFLWLRPRDFFPVAKRRLFHLLSPWWRSKAAN